MCALASLESINLSLKYILPGKFLKFIIKSSILFTMFEKKNTRDCLEPSITFVTSWG